MKKNRIIKAWAEIKTPSYTQPRRNGLTSYESIYMIGKTKKAIKKAIKLDGFGYAIVPVEITLKDK